MEKGILNMNPSLRLSKEVANVNSLNAIMLMHVVGYILCSNFGFSCL